MRISSKQITALRKEMTGLNKCCDEKEIIIYKAVFFKTHRYIGIEENIEFFL